MDGTLVGVSAGKVVVKDKNGNTFWIDKNDPRYLSGELISVLTGSKLTETTKNKISNSLKDEKNPAATPVIINGILYNTIKEASYKLNLPRHVVSNRCNSNKDEWKNWNKNNKV